MDILQLISEQDRIDFSQNFAITRNYMGDRLFPDQKTQNLEIEYYRLTDGQQLPTAAFVHAFDTEAVIGTRKPIEKVTMEKLLIKEKLNQSEKVRLYLNSGASQDAIVQLIFDDAANLAESVKTRTEVAKMEALTTGEMIVKENHLNFKVSYGVPNSNKKTFTWTDEEADVLADIQDMVDTAKDSGHTVNKAITSTAIVTVLRKNKGVQTAIYGANGVGTFLSLGHINQLMSDMFGFTIEINDDRYKVQKANGSYDTKRYIDSGKFVLCQTNSAGAFGAGLWGVTPEEEEQGNWTAKSQDQYITITQWKTPDPTTVWTKASGVFIPVIPDPSGLVIADVTTA